jgi:hypothetical protein
MPTSNELRKLCREMTRRAAASPLDPLPEAEPAIVESAKAPHALAAVVKSRRRWTPQTALADVYAICRQHGLAARRIEDVVKAILAADTIEDLPDDDRHVRKLREAAVLDAVAALVRQAKAAK